MSGEKSKNGIGTIVCILICAVAALSVVLSLLEYSVPAVVTAVIILIIAVLVLAFRNRFGTEKKYAEIGFVTALSGTVFVVAYVVLSYVAYLAVQSF